MLYRIIDLIIREDTFRLFTNKSSSSNMFQALEKSPIIKTAEDLKARLKGYFDGFLSSSCSDSLHFSEASRLLGFVDKIFNELKEIDSGREGGIRNPIDDTIDFYIKSLSTFVEELDIPVLKEHVKFVVS